MSRDAVIVVFDALCPLCTHSVSFLMKRNRKQLLTFVSMQSQAGKNLMQTHGITLEMDTFLVIMGSRCLIRSEAVLGIARQLGGAWRLLGVFYVIPRPLRDRCYTFVAKNRYQWFGTHQNCEYPSDQ